MELPIILTVIFSFIALKTIIEHRSAARTERLKLLEKAVQQQHLDRGTLEGLAYQLTGRHSPNRDPDLMGRRWRAVILAVGWLCMFAGGATWIGGEMARCNDAILVGVILLVSGFAVTTYPFALRELEARRLPR